MIKIFELGKIDKSDIFKRVTPEFDVEKIVSGIISDVKTNGDTAVLDYCDKFDKVKLSFLEVSADEFSEALSKVEPEFIEILKKAASNIKKFHKKQIRNSFIINDENGIVMGQKVMPLEKVGLYVPGGTAAYPSSVLMNAIPAKLAGCKEIVITTPPDKDGKVNPAILAAASVAGVNRVFKVGGAQAIAALAFGTESIPKVDKIVGPGNAFVAEAKKQVFGKVAIDMIAGPSEILIISDGSSNPRYLAADMLSQAEHDRLASAVLVTDSLKLAKAVQKEIEKQLKALERQDIASASIENNGKIIVCKNLEDAIAVANEIAPEHLELSLDNPFDYLDKIRHAGSIFMGKNCPEALGDYFSGANHTLPTSGTARFSSPLSVDDFVKKMQYTYYTKDALKMVAKDVEYFAKKEGLTAHAKSAVIRIED